MRMGRSRFGFEMGLGTRPVQTDEAGSHGYKLSGPIIFENREVSFCGDNLKGLQL